MSFGKDVGPMDWPCDMCSGRFTVKQDIVIHLMQHTGIVGLFGFFMILYDLNFPKVKYKK